LRHVSRSDSRIVADAQIARGPAIDVQSA